MFASPTRDFVTMAVGFRHKRLAALSQMQVSEDSCTLCFDNRASVTLLPCTHRYQPESDKQQRVKHLQTTVY